MENKSSLGEYRACKSDWGGVDHMYDNSRGSGLLADARAGMLDTNVLRHHFEERSALCDLCGVEDETVGHVVLGCHVMGVREVSLCVALGLGEDVNRDEVTETKKRLSWWKSRKEELHVDTT